MNRTPSSAASLRRRSVMAVIITMVLALLGSNAHAIAAPQQAPVLQFASANNDPAGPVDEEYEFYKQLVQDIRDHAEDVEVRDAAAAALAENTKEKLVWFLDHGQAEAQARADQRKAGEKAANRKKVEEWARTGGPNVKAGAQAALNSGDQAIADFVAYGYEIALKQDRQQAEDDKAEQDRITGRVRDMVAHGGPQVKVEGEAILLSNDYARIREFYLTGYHEANKRDHEFQLVIEKALADRNKALTELDQLARRSETAARARAEIMRANINAVKAMEDGIFAMQMAVKAAHKADKIFRDDKACRPNGCRGRNQEIDALRAEAAEYAARGDRVAVDAQGINAQVHEAGARLVDTGLTNGLDWVKVTIGITHAVEAAALAGETSQHAVEATLADSRALDADQNAREHANNAHKYRAEAERQAQKAIDLAAAARVQRDIAIAARDRAEQQKNIAAQKAAQAKQHAANARTARVNAQHAATNAIAKSKDATTAYNNAVQHKFAMDETVRKAETLGKEVMAAEHAHGQNFALYNDYIPKLEAARKKADELGGEAWNEYYAIERETNNAKAAADQSAAWASRARAAAATARAEAQKATAAANAAHQAALRANQEAVTARRAADETHRLALETANAAVASHTAAEMVHREAESAVREANQSVYQSMIADRASAAAAASAEMVIDPVRSAEAILKPYAAINADARKALAGVAEALLISEEQSRLAREKATEAAAAAVRARKAADEAIADIKPAYEAAARAVDAANAAAQDALTANDAANAAAQHANAAAGSASTAARWANSARSDAALAGQSARAATSAAATAGQAAGAAEKLRSAALEVAKGFDAFEASIVERLNQVVDIRNRYDEAVRIAQAEGERKRQELNKLVLEALAGSVVCKVMPLIEMCKEQWARIGQAIGPALEAVGNYIEDWILCSATGEPGACQRYHDKAKKVRDFAWEAVKGFAEAAVSGLVTAWEVGGCVVSGVDSGDWSKCKTILDNALYVIQNPYMWVNLPEWQTNPGKAFGGLMWDLAATVATIHAGGAGGAASKTIRTLSQKIDGGSGPLSKQLADLESLVVKLHDSFSHKLPNAIGELFNLQARFDSGNAKFDGAIAIVDDQLYRVEPFTLRPEGSPNLVDGAIIRLEGGTLKLENGLAKLEDAKLKVDPPIACVAGAMAAAAAADKCDSAGVTDPKTGEYRAVEQGVEIKLTKEENDRANALLLQAKNAESTVTAEIDKVEDAFPGAERVKGHERKEEASLKRKLFNERSKEPQPSLDQAMHEINDSLRYTIKFRPETYAQDVLDTIRRFDTNPNYEVPVVKNKWAKNDGTSYKGVNMTIETKGGLRFELQLHTPDSYNGKDREHKIYQKKRLAVSQEQLDKLDELSKKIFGDVPFPVGAIDIPERR